MECGYHFQVRERWRLPAEPAWAHSRKWARHGSPSAFSSYFMCALWLA